MYERIYNLYRGEKFTTPDDLRRRYTMDRIDGMVVNATDSKGNRIQFGLSQSVIRIEK